MKADTSTSGLQVAGPRPSSSKNGGRCRKTGLTAEAFWAGALRTIFGKFAPRNAALLEKRADLQAKIDDRHRERAGQPRGGDGADKAFLTEIGYLVPEPRRSPFRRRTLMPSWWVTGRAAAGRRSILNALFLLNAANARWGSSNDALDGTDAIPGAAQGKGYYPVRAGR
jgi:malate synthase